MSNWMTPSVDADLAAAHIPTTRYRGSKRRHAKAIYKVFSVSSRAELLTRDSVHQDRPGQ